MDDLLALLTIGAGSAIFVVTALGKLRDRIPLRFLIVAFIILNFVDIVLTMDGIMEFGPSIEANPIIVLVLEAWGVWGLFVVKLIVVPSLLLSYAALKDRKVRYLNTGLWFVLALYAFYIIPGWLFGPLTCDVRGGKVFGFTVAPVCELKNLLL
jgi:hypothetical protein